MRNKYQWASHGPFLRGKAWDLSICVELNKSQNKIIIQQGYDISYPCCIIILFWDLFNSTQIDRSHAFPRKKGPWEAHWYLFLKTKELYNRDMIYQIPVV